MRPSRSNAHCAKFTLLSLYLLATAIIAESQSTPEDLQGQATADQLGKPDSSVSAPTAATEKSIFDFENYMRLFNKVYRDGLEQMARNYYFSVRAIRVFISAIRYRHGEQLYYFAINALSDASPEELDRMRNKVMEGDVDATPDQLVDDVEPMDSSDDIEADLRQLARENQDEPAFRELGEFLDKTSEPKQRNKRAVSRKKLRYLPKEKLINIGSSVELDPEVQAKVTSRVPSNNPAYKPIELSSNGLADEQAPVVAYHRKKPLLGVYEIDGVVKHLEDLFADDGTWKRDSKGPANDDEDADEELPDEVFLDLRNSTKCFLLPRYQGFCGACYAFAITTIAEWQLCMQTKKLVALSEQYMIDCGKEYVSRLKGCNGGDRLASAKFIHNFGLELRIYYPYLARNGTCPYYDDEPLNTTGYIRTNWPELFQVSLKELPTSLTYGPIYAEIKTEPSFSEYGGGVRGVHCPDDHRGRRHAVVLVGHGRENGREYWLIRNSYGAGWGEQGYYKLDKSVGGICDRMGFAFATKNGFGRKMNLYLNPDNPEDRMRQPKTGPKINPALFPDLGLGSSN